MNLPLTLLPRLRSAVRGITPYLFGTLLCATLSTAGACAQKGTQEPDSYNYKRGVEAYDNDKYDDAVDYLQRELKEHPKNGFAAYYLACTHYAIDSEKRDVVIKGLNEALKLLPKKAYDFRARALTSRGVVQAELGDTAKALADYTLAAEIDPEYEQPLQYRAYIYNKQGKTTEAEADYREALRRQETSVDAYIGLADLSMDRNDYQAALPLLTRALALNGSSQEAGLKRSICYYHLKKYREATSDAIGAYAMGGDYAVEAGNLLSALADSAFVHVDTQLRAKALEEKDDDGAWTFLLAVIYSDTGHYKEAIAAYKRLEKGDEEKRPAIAYAMARTYASLYDYPTALRYIDQAVEGDSADADYAVQRADIYYNLDRREAALAEADRTVRLAPDTPGAYALRASLREAYGDDHGALDDYQTAMTLLEAGDASLSLHRARIEDRLGDKAAARRDYEEVVRLDSIPHEASSGIFALAALGDTAKARVWNDSILARTKLTDRPGNLYNAACLFAVMGQSDRALDYLRQAFEAGYRDLVHMRYDHDMDGLRELPRYKELVSHFEKVYATELAREAESDSPADAKAVKVTTEVPFTREAGIYKVKCTINGLPLHFYFDTGAADVTISSVEAAFMLKNGYLSRNDLGGRQYYGNASGEITEGTTVTLRSVEFGGLTLCNIKASVVHNQSAPLLLGQTVLSRLGSIEIDYANSVLKITYLKR